MTMVIDPVRYANMVAKVLKKTEEIEKAKVRTIRIKFQPQAQVPGRTTKQFCQAINMNNKQCQFRAVCGKYCKKHQVEEVAPEPRMMIDFSDSDSEDF